MTECLPFEGDLPEYTRNERRKDIGQDPLPEKHKAFQNDLCVQLNRFMNHFGQTAADIIRGTTLEHSTFSGWVNNKVDVQLLDSQIKELARFWGVTIDYLAFGTPMTERDFEIEKAMDDSEERNMSA